MALYEAAAAATASPWRCRRAAVRPDLARVILRCWSGRDSAASRSRSLPQMTPPPGAAGGLLNPIVGSLIMTLVAVPIGTPTRHPGRHLYGGIRPLRKADRGRAVHQRHSALARPRS